MRSGMTLAFALVALVLGSGTPAMGQRPTWALTPRVGFVDLTTRSFGLGISYQFDERRPVYGVSLSRLGEGPDLEISYRYIPSEMETYAYVFVPPGPGRTTPTLAVADLDAHLIEAGLSLPLVRDRENGREFLATVGAGLAVFDPGTNRVLRSLDDEPVEGPVPTDLEVTVDPLVSAGVGLQLPIRKAFALRFDFSYVLQFCGRGSEIESRYLCSRDAILEHAVLETGVRVPVR